MKFKIPTPILPSEEEMIEISTNWWNEQALTSFAAWSPKLRSLSYPIRAISLKPIVKKIEAALETYSAASVEALVPDFEELIGDVPPRFFCKLITRSPKDFLYDEGNKGKPRPLTSVRDLVTSLFASMRTHEDLCSLIYLPDVIGITIRPYIDFDPLDEWRVLIKEGKIMGISQYYYDEPWDDHVPLSMVEPLIRDFINNQVTPSMGIKSFIADVVTEFHNDPSILWFCQPPPYVMLLETNPYGLSDPCLFVSYDNLDGTLKVNV